MYLVLSKKKGPRRTDRNRCKRFRAKVKAKNRDRRNRVYQNT